MVLDTEVAFFSLIIVRSGFHCLRSFFCPKFYSLTIRLKVTSYADKEQRAKKTNSQLMLTITRAPPQTLDAVYLAEQLCTSPKHSA
jgi:hypothetical protein